jgi:MYND finger
MSRNNALDEIAAAVRRLDLYQPRDWPHREGDTPSLDLLSFPLTQSSGGRRSVACELCSGPCLCIHDNVMCWKCKGAFCLHCYIPNHNMLLTLKMADVLQHGFARCKTCGEPLRSIGLIDVFRPILEAGGPFISRNNPLDMCGGRGSGASLLQEAEDALKRGQECNKRNPEQAIQEFTHAINAVNYLTSMTLGTGLLLRAKDVLLIAHGLRAELENNPALTEAIRAAYPRASVKTKSSVNDGPYFLSRSAYEALYYSMPASLLPGGKTASCVFIDMRSQTRDSSFESAELEAQLSMTDQDLRKKVKDCRSYHPHNDGEDPRFFRLNGTFRGLISYVCSWPGLHFPSFPHGTVLEFIQFIRVFSTKLEASEYTRTMIEAKEIGEESPPLNSKENSNAIKLLKKKAKELGVTDLSRVMVLEGSHMMMSTLGFNVFSFVATIGNVSTKLFLCILQGDHRMACEVAARAFAYLHSVLHKYRSNDPSSLPEAPPFHHPDQTLCAYCGKASDSLKMCTRCKLARYCSRDCQSEHWGQALFGHKKLCKAVASGKF